MFLGKRLMKPARSSKANMTESAVETYLHA